MTLGTLRTSVAGATPRLESASGPLALLVAAVVAVGLGAVAGRLPLAALLVPVVALIGLMMVTKVDTSLVIVLFILYSNAAAVAVRLHGVPVIVAAVLPLLLGIPLVYRVLVRREPVILTPAVPFLVVFVLTATVSAALSRDSTRSFDSLVTLILEGVVLYLLITNVIRSENTVRLAFWTLVTAGAFMGGLSLFQELTGTHADPYFGFAQMTTVFRVGAADGLGAEVLQARAAGPIGEMNFYAQILLMLVPLGLALASIERQRILRLAAFGATALIASGVVLTFSRGAAVGFVLAMLAAIVLRLVNRRQIALMAVGAVLIVILFPAYSERLATLDIAQADASFQSRAAENQAALLTFIDHPVVGVGLGVFPTYYAEYIAQIGGRLTGDTREAHNLYLGLAAETGIVGIIAFAGIILMTLRRLFQTRSRGPGHLPTMATALLLSVLLFLTTSAFLHMAYERYFWLMLALAGAAGVVGIRGAAAREPASPDRTAAREPRGSRLSTEPV